MSPYFDETHEALRDVVRQFVDTDIKPHVVAWEEAGLFPRDLYRLAAERDILALGYEEELGGVEGDVFHGLVISEELSRCGALGVVAGLGSHAISLPLIQALGTPQQKQQFIPPVLSGDKISALAVTEAGAGSDVAAIQTKAIRDGDHYVVSGNKLFITSGVRADFLVTAVRTGGAGHDGLSIMIIETDRPGVMVSGSLKKMGWCSSDTAELAFDEVRVPVANLLGAEGLGFKAIMGNFQRERLNLAVMAYASAQLAFEASRDFARQRMVFGKPLIAKQIIRHKLAHMLTGIEVSRQYVYHAAAPLTAGRPPAMEVAVAKNAAVKACDFAVNEAVQIHGGMGYMRDTLVERLYRDTRILGIGGGANEIMDEIICKAGGITP